MKINLLKYFLLIFGFLLLVIIYLSVVGIETDRFNNQIKNKLIKIDKKLNLDLKKIKLTLDPINLQINAKTVGSVVFYANRPLSLEYIKTKVSFSSFIKNKIISSNIEIASRSIFLKDFVRFVRGINNTPQLFIFENMIKKGHIIFDLNLNFDENGNIKSDYELKGTLKETKINFFKNNIFENINFNFNLKKNNYLFEQIKFRTNKVNFISKYLNIKKKGNKFFVDGEVENKQSILNIKLLKLLKFDLNDVDLNNVNFDSKNKFSFEIDNKLDLKNFILNSDINIDQLKYKQPIFLKEYFSNINEIIIFKDQEIKLKYINNKILIKGKGKIKLEKEFDDIRYLINKNGNNFKIISDLNLEKLNLKKNNYLNFFFPVVNNKITLKDQKINLEFQDKKFSLSGKGKIKINKAFEDIDYILTKNDEKLNFDLNLNLIKTKFKLDPLNYKKKNVSTLKLEAKGNYEKDKKIIINNFSILEGNNRIKINNLVLGKNNQIAEVEKINFDYVDTENKQNQITIKKKDQYNYELNGLVYNANSLIEELLKNEDKIENQIFKNDISLNLNINEVFIDKIYSIKNLSGNLFIKKNKVNSANFSANLKNKDNITFTIISDESGNKITTLASSWAKPLISRYKFIKGFEEGNLDFISNKKDGISNSKLIIDNFKVKEIPVLAKLLTLASLQGIADLLTGEGLRFTDLEMNFSNEKKLMRIEELYAIGPSISILMEGYVEKDKLISLRGTLVPATTINRTIASIPLIGDFLIGKKVGEGVFGVSFKIKGPPKNLETTVNPIKTLTPRFITRTLKKLKKN